MKAPPWELLSTTQVGDRGTPGRQEGGLRIDGLPLRKAELSQGSVNGGRLLKSLRARFEISEEGRRLNEGQDESSGRSTKGPIGSLESEFGANRG